MNTRKLGVIAGTVAIGITLMTGCGSYNDERGKGDAPVAGHKGDDSPAYVTNMPDGFGNVAAKCLAGFPGMAVAVTTDKKREQVFPYAACK